MEWTTHITDRVYACTDVHHHTSVTVTPAPFNPPVIKEPSPKSPPTLVPRKQSSHKTHLRLGNTCKHNVIAFYTWMAIVTRPQVRLITHFNCQVALTISLTMQCS